MKTDNERYAAIINNPNTKVIAINNYKKAGFSIYLSISGRLEYVMSHRHNAFLYNLLKDGLSISELKRWNPRSYDVRRMNNIVSSVYHIFCVVQDFIYEMVEYEIAA